MGCMPVELLPVETRNGGATLLHRYWSARGRDHNCLLRSSNRQLHLRAGLLRHAHRDLRRGKARREHFDAIFTGLDPGEADGAFGRTALKAESFGACIRIERNLRAGHDGGTRIHNFDFEIGCLRSQRNDEKHEKQATGPHSNPPLHAKRD